MKTRVALLLLVAVPVYADWMDDVCQYVDIKERTIDLGQTKELLQRLVEEDNKALKQHEEDTEATDASFWGNVAGYLNVAKWGTAKVTTMKHEKVLEVMQGLQDDQEAYDTLVTDLIYLINRNAERENLRSEYTAARTWKEKVTLRTQVAAKTALITARKAKIEGAIIIS